MYKFFWLGWFWISAFFPQPFSRQASRDQVWAAALGAKLFAVSVNLNHLLHGLKSKPPRDTVVEEIEVGVLKLNHPATINTDQMVVRWLFEEIWIVSRLMIAEIDLPQQVGLDQQTQRAVDRRSGGLRVQFTSTFEQFIRREMLVLGKGRLGNGVSLTRPAQPFASDKIVESFLYAAIHNRFLANRISNAKPKP